MKTHLFRMLFLSLGLIASGCASFKDITATQSELGIAKSPTSEMYPDADGVIILESHDVDLDFDNNWNVSAYQKIHMITKLFKNFDDQANVEIYIGRNEKLISISARTVTAAGKSIPLEKDDFHKVTGDGGEAFYSDRQSLRFAFKGVEKDAYIEYEYKVRNDRPFSEEVWYIQGDMPKLRNQYIMHVPKVLLDNEWNWYYKNYNYNIGDPVVSEPIITKGDEVRHKRTFEWTLKDIPAFTRERRMPATHNYSAYVKFAPSDWKTYSDIASWYHKNYFAPQVQITEALQTKAAIITRGLTSETDKVRALQNYVKAMRYTAIELGIGGIKPNFPQVVMDRQYGDCKDKSTLLISLLRSVGITAKPVLVLTADQGSVDPSFANWTFNHMIVKVEPKNGSSVWVDPTASSYDLGELPWVCEGINVLVINEDGSGKLEVTPASDEKENVMQVNVQVKNTSQTDALFDIDIQFMGEEYNYYRNVLSEKSESDKKKMCQSMIVDDYIGAEISQITTAIDTAKKITDIHFSFKAEKAIQQQGDLYFLNADPFKLFDSWGWLIYEKRRYPVDFQYPYTVKKNLVVNLDHHLAARNLPKNMKLNTEHLFYNKQFVQNSEQQWSCQETFFNNNYAIMPIEYPEAKQFFQKMKASMEEKTVLTSK